MKISSLIITTTTKFVFGSVVIKIELERIDFVELIPPKIDFNVKRFILRLNIDGV